MLLSNNETEFEANGFEVNEQVASVNDAERLLALLSQLELKPLRGGIRCADTAHQYCKSTSDWHPPSGKSYLLPVGISWAA